MTKGSYYCLRQDSGGIHCEVHDLSQCIACSRSVVLNEVKQIIINYRNEWMVHLPEKLVKENGIKTIPSLRAIAADDILKLLENIRE